MTPKVKKIVKMSLWALSSLGFVLLVSWSSYKQNNTPCTAINVTISEKNNLDFVTKPEVVELIQSKGSVIGVPLGKINTNMLEKLIDKHPSISRTQVYKSIEGVLNVEVTQRVPAIRIFTNRNETYYIDTDGKIMPISDNFSDRILVATGNISGAFRVDENLNRYDTLPNTAYNQLYRLYKLAEYINANEFWRSQITQVYVNENNDFEMIPRVGQHIIVLGDIDNLEEKFEKLMIFYKKGLNKIGWTNYKTINIKYKNQIVCTKI